MAQYTGGVGPLHQWDIETFRAINGLRSPVLDGLFWLVTSTGLGHVQFPLLLVLGYRGPSPSPREGGAREQSERGGGKPGLPPSPTASGLPPHGGEDLPQNPDQNVESPSSGEGDVHAKREQGAGSLRPGNPAPSHPTTSARVPLPGGGGFCATLWSRFHPAAQQALIAGVVAGIIRLPLMRLAGRPRPSNLNFAQPMESVFGNSSFPSGHTTTSFAIAVAVLLALPPEKKKWGWGLLLWASAVAFSRVYCGVHYPTDVIGGALLGSAVAAAVNLIRPLRARE